MIDIELEKLRSRLVLEDLAMEVRFDISNMKKVSKYVRCCEIYKIRYNEEFYLEIDETKTK